MVRWTCPCILEKAIAAAEEARAVAFLCLGERKQREIETVGTAEHRPGSVKKAEKGRFCVSISVVLSAERRKRPGKGILRG